MGVARRALLLDGGPQMAYDDAGARAVSTTGCWGKEVVLKFDVAGQE